MAIEVTDEMWAMYEKYSPYIVRDYDTMSWHFIDGTPQEIIELKKKFTELYHEQERKAIELDEFGWG